MMQIPWRVFRNHDQAYPWGIRDADEVEVARFNDKLEAETVDDLVNATHKKPSA